MQLYFHHTFSNTKSKKPWFNSACSRASKDREADHKRYPSYPSAKTHALYISNRNQAKSILQLTKNSSINSRCLNLSILTLLMISSLQPILFLTILLHFFLSYFKQIAPQLYLLSLKLNSSLKSLLPTLLWMILSIFLLLLHPLTTSSL